MKTHAGDEVDAAWARAIEARLNVEVIGRSVTAFVRTTSTSDVARGLAANGAADGAVVIARTQNRGRGRRGRTWLSTPGEGAYLSVALRPELPAGDVGWLAILGGVAVVCALEKLGLKKLKLKWPNDVLAGGRKIAGVLVEPRLSAEAIEFAVLGIGVNVAQTAEAWPGDLKEKATSCRTAGLDVSCDDVLVAVLGELDHWYSVLKSKKFEPLMKAWVQRGGVSRVPDIS